MKKIIAAFVFLLFVLHSFSQPTITGRVIDPADGAPVPGSSVFIANTTKGTVADRDGRFELTGIPPGRHELIISSIGYETNVFSFNTEDLPLRLKIELQVKVKELANVVVEPSEEGDWNKWGKTFTDNFIGCTANAGDCKIKNKEAIKFRYYRKSNRLIAYLEEPLIIENRALGYRVSFKLEDFEVNFKERTSLFLGYPLFEDMEKDGKELRSRWKRAREKAFYGSIMHFMRSVYRNNLDTQGFEVRRMYRLPNIEKERVKKLYSFSSVKLDANHTEIITNKNDSAEYYSSVLHQPDFIDKYGTDLLTADSIIVQEEGNYKVLFFTDYLFVTFRNATEEKEYLLFFHEMRKPAFQRSFVNLTGGQPIIIDVNGSYDPPNQFYAGAYWGWREKIANLLPLDYKPEKD